MKTYHTSSEAYLGTLQDVYFNYDHRSAPRGLPVREKLDYTFRVLEPSDSPIETKDQDRNVTIASYTAKEVALYNSCTVQASDFAQASKFWNTIANPDGTVNSAYGHLIWSKRSHGNPMFESGLVRHENGATYFPGPAVGIKDTMRTPWEWAKLSLQQDKDTRQAILRFSLPEHQWIGNKDQTCTMHANFLIRDDKLHLSVVMRSNDLVLGLVYDMPWFMSLIDKMVEELKPTYPHLQKGHYTHTVHSLHIYERNEELVKKMLGVV
jgi:thymidylate synthase